MSFSGIDWDELDDDATARKADDAEEQAVNEQAALEELAAACKRWENEPPPVVWLDRRSWWVVLSALQLAARHPKTAVEVKARIEHAGRQIQGIVCDSIELYELAEAGWDPPQDRKT